MAKVKTIFRQIDQLFSMSRSFGGKKKELRDEGKLAAALPGSATYDIYRGSCMRFAEDLAERRGTTKFQICSITSDEVKNFLERVEVTKRPDTVHQYSSALRKLEEMTTAKFGSVSWKIEDFERPRRSREDVTVQRGPAYLPQEADLLVDKLRGVDKQAGDALEFIRATGCRAETIFGSLRRSGGKVVVDGRVVVKAEVFRDLKKAITTDRINLVNKTVTLIEKGGKVRVVNYDQKYQGLMKRLVKETPFGEVFAGVNQQTMYSKIHRIANESGFDGRGLHGMRKTFAVQRHVEYIDRIKELISLKDWRLLAAEFPISGQKARRMCNISTDKMIDLAARLRLSRDLGHNRVEVTYRYAPRGQKK